MNSAYEIEYNRLKSQIEEIALKLEELVKNGTTFLEPRNRPKDEDRGDIIKGIEMKSRELEFEILRFLAEHRPCGSDLRTVTVLARLGRGFSGLAGSLGVLMREIEVDCRFDEFFSKVVNLIQDVLKQLANGIIEEDFDSSALSAKTVEIEKLLDSWYQECEKKVEGSGIAPAELLTDVKCATILEQAERILKGMISELTYMITGSYDQPTNGYTVVALE